MQVAIVSTKLFVPSPRPDLIHRPRLIEQLNAGLRRGHRLTLISAPAGFGKTMLASEWVHQLDRPFAWLSLENDDTDPLRFIGCLVAALQSVDNGIGSTVQTALESRQFPSWEWLLTHLIDDIAVSPIPFVLVLDDGRIVPSPHLYELLEILLEHQPPQLHVALLTRAVPPFVLARLRAADQLTEIRADDLRFTNAEIAAFFTQTQRLPLAPPLIDTLAARTEGWIAGLQLAALSLHGRADLAAGRLAYVANHLAEAQQYLETGLDLAQQLGLVPAILVGKIDLARLKAALRETETALASLACLTQAVELAAPEDDRRVFLDAGQPLLDLLPLVRQVAPRFVDQVLSDAGIQPATPPQPLAEPLTMREVEIVRLIATGLSNEEVAKQLVIAPGTVKKHLDHIYGKLGVHRRAQAAARARALGLV